MQSEMKGGHTGISNLNDSKTVQSNHQPITTTPLNHFALLDTYPFLQQPHLHCLSGQRVPMPQHPFREGLKSSMQQHCVQSYLHEVGKHWCYILTTFWGYSNFQTQSVPPSNAQSVLPWAPTCCKAPALLVLPSTVWFSQMTPFSLRCSSSL